MMRLLAYVLAGKRPESALSPLESGTMLSTLMRKLKRVRFWGKGGSLILSSIEKKQAAEAAAEARQRLLKRPSAALLSCSPRLNERYTLLEQRLL